MLNIVKSKNVGYALLLELVKPMTQWFRFFRHLTWVFRDFILFHELLWAHIPHPLSTRRACGWWFCPPLNAGAITPPMLEARRARSHIHLCLLSRASALHSKSDTGFRLLVSLFWVMNIPRNRFWCSFFKSILWWKRETKETGRGTQRTGGPRGRGC